MEPTSRRPARGRKAPANKRYVKKIDLGSPISPSSAEIQIPADGEDGATNSFKSDEGPSEIKNDEVGEGSSDGVGGGVVDVISLLEELQLAEEEPELSADQLRINNQLQEDELLAMESIYGENVVILDRQKGLRTFQIRIEIKVPEELTITAKLDSSSKTKTESTSTDDFSYSFKVQFLPPIVLTCSLPESYPSHKPPYFTLSVQWLDSLRVSKLCSVLDSIWVDQQGQEVIYQWVDWLQTTSLSHLDICKDIILGPYGIKHTGDRRAVSGSISPDVDVPSLRRFNDEQVFENFVNNLQECCICFSEHPGSDFIRLSCQHFFCRNCMKVYSSMHVSEGTVFKLQCPESKCGCMIPPSLLKQVLGDEEYERYESLMLQKTLECMSDIVTCPRCEMICIEDEQNFAQCPNCYFGFCSLCKDKRHVGVACLPPELRIIVLQERANSSRLSEAQRRAEKNKINDYLSEQFIARDSKQCPKCKMAISRTGGCNKMSCSNCGNYFCYLCNWSIDGYDHFRAGGCELFPTETIRQWNEQMNPGQVTGQARAAANPGVSSTCPICGQKNTKWDNNNQVKCRGCQNTYCHLCRKVVKVFAEHFGVGPMKCRQHTPG